jgi:hypothetical protein
MERAAADRTLLAGTSGHARLYRLILGDVTERVIRNAPRPAPVSAGPPPKSPPAEQPD